MADLHLCSLADLEVEDASVDLILTDPPYPREYLPLWGDLASLAVRALRPGGSLIAMSGQLFMPDVLKLLAHDGLTYQWTLACMSPGSQSRIWHRKMFQGWKPVLWYSKGKPTAPRKWREDKVVSRPDKRFHVWGQSFAVFQDLVESFSNYGDLVCDPFLGGGTTGAAAVIAGRRFIGCDVWTRNA